MNKSTGEIILYQSSDGETKIEVHMQNETVWLTQPQMATLFQCERSVITKHLKNIFDSGELNKESNVQILHIAFSDKPAQYYNLDVIISIGYRVKSHRGIQFRIWATQTLREYLIKGFVVNDERLSSGQSNYFEELLERVRKIRTSEANLYEKVKAIFSTSIDYQSGSDYAKHFYAIVQNKFHYAITGHTAAELIVKRVDSKKPSMG